MGIGRIGQLQPLEHERAPVERVTQGERAERSHCAADNPSSSVRPRLNVIPSPNIVEDMGRDSGRKGGGWVRQAHGDWTGERRGGGGLVVSKRIPQYKTVWRYVVGVRRVRVDQDHVLRYLGNEKSHEIMPTI